MGEDNPYSENGKPKKDLDSRHMNACTMYSPDKQLEMFLTMTSSRQKFSLYAIMNGD